MKYKYTFIDDGKGTGFQSLGINLPPSIKNTAGLLYEMKSEATKDWYLEGIDLVLTGKAELEDRYGEGVGAKIRKEFTEIYSVLDEGEPVYCTIETTELRELIEIWWKEYLEFNKDNLDKILINEFDLAWKDVQKAMKAEQLQKGPDFNLDPKKYRKMGAELAKKYKKELDQKKALSS